MTALFVARFGYQNCLKKYGLNAPLTAPVLVRCCGCMSSQTQVNAVLSKTEAPRRSLSAVASGNTANSVSRKWAIAAAGALLGSGVFLFSRFAKAESIDSSPIPDSNNTTPVYSSAEISKHNNMKDGIWVTYDGNVYDISDFIEQHPGGSSKILLAAGGALEPYWDMYAIHKKDEVLEILKEYHIGTLRAEDRVKRAENDKGPFSSDPARHPALVVNSKQPFNGETPPLLATDNFLTPNELFFTRNHLPVPVVNEKDFRLEISDNGKASGKLSLENLKSKFKEHKVTATLQCAGNRRSEMNPIKAVRGLNWFHNAISNAEWKGVLLRDVLLAAGIDPKSPDVKHIQFEGLDVGPSGKPYGSSVPSRYVFSEDSEVLLAYEMNGEPIPRDHGYPLRVIIPGIVGARNVKWLSKVIVSSEESDSHWQQNDYKGFSPNTDWDNVNFSSAPAIQELPVTSAICLPQKGDIIDEEEEEVSVRGYAYSGGGKGIVRVDVSADNGKTWHTAELQQGPQELTKMWAWTLWEASIPIPEGHTGEIEIVCKAVDSSYNCQPDSVAPIWNLRGVLNNSWHRVQLKIKAEN